jgi:hypothetical protein
MTNQFRNGLLGGVAAKPPESSVTRKKGTMPEELKTLKTANNTLPDAKYGLEVERLSRRPTPARCDGALHRDSRPEARRRVRTLPPTRASLSSLARDLCNSASARQSTARPVAGIQSLLEDSGLASCSMVLTSSGSPHPWKASPRRVKSTAFGFWERAAFAVSALTSSLPRLLANRATT